MGSPIEIEEVVNVADLARIQGSPPGKQMQMLMDNMKAAMPAPSSDIPPLDDEQDALDQMEEFFRR